MIPRHERAVLTARRPLFNLASLRKVFEATLLAQAVLKGELGLDDPVAKTLSSCNKAATSAKSCSNDVCSWGKTGGHILVESLRAVFGTIHRTCLSALVTDRAMEAWYHSSIA